MEFTLNLTLALPTLPSFTTLKARPGALVQRTLSQALAFCAVHRRELQQGTFGAVACR